MIVFSIRGNRYEGNLEFCERRGLRDRRGNSSMFCWLSVRGWRCVGGVD